MTRAAAIPHHQGRNGVTALFAQTPSRFGGPAARARNIANTKKNTAPATRLRLKRTQEPLYEFACHESNFDIVKEILTAPKQR